MYRILVCDDKERCRAFLSNEIKDFFSKINKDYMLDYYSSGDQVLFHYKPGFYDIAFFDVEMQGTNGIETAKRVRGMDRNVIIIFATAHKDTVFSSFAAEPLTFLTKPLLHQEVEDALRRAMKQMDHARARKFVYEIQKNTSVIPVKDILYFESNGRKVDIVTLHSRITFYSKLDNIHQNSSVENFIRCHKSYLINPDYIMEIGNSGIELTTKELLPIRRGAYKELREQFFRYLSTMD